MKLLFPQPIFNVTQGSYGTYSHNIKGKEKAIDIAGKDGSAEKVYASAPGVIRSIERKYNAYLTVDYFDVETPYGKYDKVNILYYHNTALENLKVGDEVKEWQHITYEGTNSEPGGYASGNHNHIETRYYPNGKRTTIIPEKVFYLKRGLHTFKQNKSKYEFYWLSDKQNKLVDQIYVKAKEYRVRANTELGDNILGYAEPGYYNVLEIKKANGYTWYKIWDNMWIAQTSAIEFKKGKKLELLGELDKDYDKITFLGAKKGSKIYIER